MREIGNNLAAIFAVTTALLIFSVGLILAEDQPTPFEKAYDQYLGSVETYNKDHADYILARSQHLKFQTLNSQEKAKKETVEMLEARDEVVIAYLKTLKERLSELDGVDDAQKQSLSIELDDEIEWFDENRDTTSSAGTLEDLVSDSDDAKSRYQGIQSLFYRVLGTASSSKVTGYRERFDENYGKLRDRINGIKNETRPEYSFDSTKLNQIDRWVFESDVRLIRSEEKKLEADAKILNLSVGRGSSGPYNSILTTLGESQQFILESVRLSKEIIREVKAD